jgi:ribokinase
MSGGLPLPAPVVVVGSINMDLVVNADHVPAPGETILGDKLRTLPGGKGANQAVAAARAGAAVSMIGRLGPDAFGTELRDGLRAEGVDVGAVGTCKHDPSGVALITVAATGENAIVVAPGANAMIRTVHVDDVVDASPSAFVAGSVVLMQLEIPLEVVVHTAVRARAVGCRVVLNPAPARPLPDELFAAIDVVIANETEVDMLGGIDALRTRVPVVVATLGAAGLTLYTSGGAVHMPGHQVDVVDTTGAGDATCGAFVAALAAGHSESEAAVRANAAGALTTTALGARTSPLAAEIDAFLAR